MSVVVLLELVLVTSWTAFASDGWPPEPYRAYSPAGAWTDLDGTGDITIITLSPPDPTTATGPDTACVKGVYYVKKEGRPKPTILSILAVELRPKFTAADMAEYEGTLSVYSPAVDKDGDGLPDADEQPLIALPTQGKMKRI